MPATRVPVFRNPSYSANAIRSYVCALNKFNITPTRSKLISRDGSNRLMMQAADGSAKAITADNQLNDVFYTCPVQIGTPGQTLALVRTLSAQQKCTKSLIELRHWLCRHMGLVHGSPFQHPQCR